MKKTAKTALICVIAALFIPMCACGFPFIQGSYISDGWILDECHMVDYEIKDDKITFEYSFCFYYDDTDLSESLETIMVTFNKREAKGWLSQSFLGLEGKDKNGKTGKIIVHPNEKNYFTLFFTGDYLGGEVNTDIKPYRIDYTMGIPDDDPYNDLCRAL